MRRLLVVLFWLAGVSSLFAGQQKPLELTLADNGKTNSVKVGQSVVLKLEGNITTGYEWELSEIDKKSVVLVGKIEYRNTEPVPPKGGKDELKTGGGGVYQAKFKALKPGKTTIRLVYWRGEKNENPYDTFTITLLVER